MEAGVHWQVESTKPTKYRATLTGKNTWSPGHLGAENTAKWTFEENKDGEDGIPAFLQAAVLLRTHASRPFFAKLRVESSVDKVSAARRALPFTTDEDKIIDHVTFTPGEQQLSYSHITGIKPSDLENMEKLPVGKYFRVNMSEQDDLLETGDSPEVVTPVVEQPQALRDRAAVTGAILAPLTTTAPLSLAVIAEALKKAAEAAANAGEAAAKSAEAAGKAADAAVKVAEALSIIAAAAVQFEGTGKPGPSDVV